MRVWQFVGRSSEQCVAVFTVRVFLTQFGYCLFCMASRREAELRTLHSQSRNLGTSLMRAAIGFILLTNFSQRFTSPRVDGGEAHSASEPQLGSFELGACFSCG